MRKYEAFEGVRSFSFSEYHIKNFIFVCVTLVKTAGPIVSSSSPFLGAPNVLRILKVFVLRTQNIIDHSRF